MENTKSQFLFIMEKYINLSGNCFYKITGKFPSYSLEEIKHEIHNQYASSVGNPSTLPKLPKYVGGDTDIMIGIQYLKYYPEKVYTLPNGLSIYKSQFLNSDGSRGLVGGPHRIFTKIHKGFGDHLSMNMYLTAVVNVYQNGYKSSLDVSLLDIKEFTPFCQKYEAGFDMEEPVYNDTDSIRKLMVDDSS